MRLRPLTAADADAVLDLMVETFADLDERFGLPAERTVADRAPGLARIRHLATTDPGGAWVTEDADGRIDGAALGLVRDGIFGLSLLVVDPRRQSGGRGSALLGEVMAYAAGTRGGIILASADARALRAYWKAGFTLLPALDAKGPVRTPPPCPPAVRPGRWPEDRALCDAVGRAVRGAAHGADIGVSVGAGADLLVHEDGGFALSFRGAVRLVAAEHPAVARALLQAALCAVPDGTDASVSFIEGRQDWAVDVVLDAGLALRPGGAVAVRGELGPLRPYLPSGAYL